MPRMSDSDLKELMAKWNPVRYEEPLALDLIELRAAIRKHRDRMNSQKNEDDDPDQIDAELYSHIEGKRCEPR